ncbi:MAG: hypothetical protein HC904_14865 [Blastochloris sp.]|nr:hypothetical protein [Blastochloris sp.]
MPRRLVPVWRMRVDGLYYGICATVAASFCAWISSQLLILGYFHLLAPVTLLANIVVMPLAALILTTSTLSVVGSVLGSFWPIWMNQVNWLVLKVMVAVIEFLAALPGGHFYVGAPWELPSSGETRFTMMAGRQASPMLLQVEGGSWLVDVGSDYVWKSALDPFRKEQGINRVDGIILTQAGTDHMGAGSRVLESLPTEFWAESGYRSRSRVFHRWLEEMEARERPKQFWRQGIAFVWVVNWSCRCCGRQLRDCLSGRRIRGWCYVLRRRGGRWCWRGIFQRKWKRCCWVPVKT